MAAWFLPSLFSCRVFRSVKPTASALAALKKKLGSCVATDRASLAAASMDSAKIRQMPSAVIRPRDENDIGTLLLLCNERGVPLTVRGGGTATTGAASPEKGGWVLDLSGWKHFELDTTAGWAYAQPGVILKTLQDAAEKTGWFYPPDPSSNAYCTVGGTLATLRWPQPEDIA